jgi:serine acetyltransferase
MWRDLRLALELTSVGDHVFIAPHSVITADVPSDTGQHHQPVADGQIQRQQHG